MSQIFRRMLSALFVVLSCVACDPKPTSRAKRQFVVGVPSQMDKVAAEEVSTAIVRLMLTAGARDRVDVVATSDMRRIAACEIPDGNVRSREAKLKSPLAALHGHFEDASSGAGGDRGPVRTPQFLDFVGTNLLRDDGATTILIFSSPYYEDSRDPGSVFRGNTYPGDGFANARSTESPYGTADRRKLLKGAVVHWSYLSDATFASDAAKTRIRRWWVVDLKGLGGVLGTFAAPPETVVDRALEGVSSPVTGDVVDEGETKLEMHTIVVIPPGPVIDASTDLAPKQETIEVGVSRQAPADPTATPAQRAMEDAARALPASSGCIDVAVVWTTDIPGSPGADVDAYFSSPAGGEVFYAATGTRGGPAWYVRDVREATLKIEDRDYAATWEVVELDPSTDLEKTSYWLNLYRGTSSAITGVVRLAVGGKVATAPFSFPRGVGSRGTDRANRASSADWVRIDLATLRKRVR